MASKFPHPLRVEAGRPPTFTTKHHAFDFLADYQARGAIRRCAHALVRPSGGRVDLGADQTYILKCGQNSFEFAKMAPASGLGIGDASRGFNGCPAGCRLFRARWRGTLTRWLNNTRPVFWWFDRQGWQVKVTLIAAIVGAPILLAASYFGVVRDLTTLVRAISEAWRGK